MYSIMLFLEYMAHTVPRDRTFAVRSSKITGTPAVRYSSIRRKGRTNTTGDTFKNYKKEMAKSIPTAKKSPRDSTVSKFNRVAERNK